MSYLSLNLPLYNQNLLAFEMSCSHRRAWFNSETVCPSFLPVPNQSLRVRGGRPHTPWTDQLSWIQLIGGFYHDADTALLIYLLAPNQTKLISV